MKITLNLSDKIIDNYLEFVNDVCGTNFKVKTLTAKQRKGVEKAFADGMIAEFEMRTDDHSGFETCRMFRDALNIDKQLTAEGFERDNG